jgi:hypothetical protein
MLDVYISDRKSKEREWRNTKGRMKQLYIRDEAIGLLEQQEIIILKGEIALEGRTKNCDLHILEKIYPRSNK